MSVTISDPQLLSELAAAESVVELIDPAGSPLGVLTRPTAAPGPRKFDPSTIPVMTQAKLDAIFVAAKKVGEHPLFEEHVVAVEDYRKIHNTTEPDDD